MEIKPSKNHTPVQHTNKKSHTPLILSIVVIFLIGGVVYLLSQQRPHTQKGQDTLVSPPVASGQVAQATTLDSVISNILQQSQGASLIASGQYLEASKYFESQYHQTTDQAQKNANGILWAFSDLRYGNAFYQEPGFAEKARATLDTLKLSTGAESGYYLYYYGYSYEMERQYDKALEYYQKAVTLFGKDFPLALATVYNQIGHVYDLQGKTDLAYENYQKAYSLDTGNAMIQLNIARILVRSGSLDEGAKHLLQIANTTNDSFLKAEAYANLADVTLIGTGSQKIETAFEYANRAMKANPNYPNAYMVRGKVLYYAGPENATEAKASYEEAIRLYPKHQGAYEYLGLLALDMGKPAEANSYFNTSLSVIDQDITLMQDDRDANTSRLYYYKSLADMALGNQDSAIDNLEKMHAHPNLLSMSMFMQNLKKDNGPFVSLSGNPRFESFIKDIKNY